MDKSDGRLPMSPNAPVRLSWDVASMVLISGDLRIELQADAQAVTSILTQWTTRIDRWIARVTSTHSTYMIIYVKNWSPLEWFKLSSTSQGYDVWWIPLQCFKPDEDFVGLASLKCFFSVLELVDCDPFCQFTTMMGWISLVFWTLDMAATLMVVALVVSRSFLCGVKLKSNDIYFKMIQNR